MQTMALLLAVARSAGPTLQSDASGGDKNCERALSRALAYITLRVDFA